jgi:acyl carrier protein
LARFRQAQGLPALSVQWGPWAEIGLAARPERAGRLSNRGFDSIRPEQGLRALHWALAETEPVLAVLPFDLRQWRQSYPQAAALPLLSALVTDGPINAPAGGGQLRAALLAAASSKDQYALLEQHLRREIAEVLRISVNRIGPATALDSLGFDSLLALELRNRLELSLGVRLSATLIWNYPTLPAMVAYLAPSSSAMLASER